MKKDSHIFLTVFICALCVLIGIFIGRNHRDDYKILTPNTQNTVSSSEHTVENYLLDINTATAAQLQQLPGIGDVIAQRIIDYREQNGKFLSVDDLLNVEGIGEKKLQEIKSLIMVGG